jgi:hypothetical protein
MLTRVAGEHYLVKIAVTGAKTVHFRHKWAAELSNYANPVFMTACDLYLKCSAHGPP